MWRQKTKSDAIETEVKMNKKYPPSPIDPLLIMAKMLSKDEFEHLLVRLDEIYQERERDDYQIGRVQLADGKWASVGDLLVRTGDIPEWDRPRCWEIVEILSNRKIVCIRRPGDGERNRGREFYKRYPVTFTFRKKRKFWARRDQPARERYAVRRSLSPDI